MPVFTVHAPPADAKRNGPDRFVFVRDGVRLWALVFGPLWLLANRLWLAFFGAVLLVIALHAVLWLTGTTAAASFWVMLLVGFLLALEAPTLHRWTLRRRGWSEAGMVVADDLISAERRFFETWSGERKVASAPQSSQAGPHFAASRSDSGIIGLFPEPGARR